MITANNPAIDQAQIVKLMDHWVSAIRTKDVAARTENYSKNVTLFDVVEPLEYFGVDAVRRRATEWFSSFRGPLDFEMQDLRIATDSDVAFSHSSEPHSWYQVRWERIGYVVARYYMFPQDR